MSTTDTSAPLDTTVPSTFDPVTGSSFASPTGAPTPDPVDLSDPIWTIHHLARALHLSVDRAREVTYSPTFPAPRAGFSRNLWRRAQVLDWFDALPAGERRSTTSATQVRREPDRDRRNGRHATRTRRTYTPRGTR